MQLEKNKYIQFWRFIFTITVVLFHISNSTALIYPQFFKGYLVVDFFFILSGYLLMNTFNKIDCRGNIWNQAVRIIKKKIFNFMPLWYITLFIVFFYRVHIYNSIYTKQQITEYIGGVVPEFFMLNGIFTVQLHANGPSWYISILLISSFLILILWAIMSKYKLNYYIASLMIGSFGVILINKHLVGSGLNNLLNGISFMLLGGAIRRFVEWFKPRAGKYIILINLIEIGLIITLFLGLFNPDIQISRYLWTIIFMGIIIISFLNCTILSKLLSNNISDYLGKISIGIYLGHMLIMVKFGFLSPWPLAETPIISTIAIVSLCILYGVFLKQLDTFVKQMWQKRSKFKMVTTNKKYTILIISFTLITISFFTERKFFEFKGLNDNQKITYVLCKILFCITVIGIIALISHMIKMIRNGEEKYKVFIRFFILIMIIYGILVYTTWPGNWNNDEIFILSCVRSFNFVFHQSIFTNIFYVLCLMLMPFAGGIVLVQAIIFASIISYIMTQSFYRFGKKSWFILPVFFSIPTLYFMLYPLRIGLYSIMFLLLLFELYQIFEDKYTSAKKLYFIGILTTIVAYFRGESICLTILIPIIMLIFFRKYVGNKVIAKTICIIIVLATIFNCINKQADKELEKKATLWSFMTGFSVLLQDDNLRSNNLEEDLNNINNIMPIDRLTLNASTTNVELLQETVGPLEFTDEEYKKFIGSAIKLIINNPIKYIKVKSDIFIQSTGVSTQYRWVPPVPNEEELKGVLRAYNISEDISAFLNSFNQMQRSKIIYALTGMYRINNGNGPVAFYIYWNQLIPIILLFLMSVVSLIKKKFGFVIISLIYYIHLILVYLMVPTNHVMYFYQFYLLGYVLSILYLLSIIGNKKISIN
ncbi:hypothetical protein UT300005_15310 [Clostridium sp. CTA-5]